MRNRELHDALREFALESAAMLSTELDAGEELPYDVVEEPGTGSVLYRYLPLTAEFIVARWDVLSKMPSARRAAESLGTGSEAYLRLRGLPAANDARPLMPGVPGLGDGPDVQLWPHLHRTDAMYLALLRRTA